LTDPFATDRDLAEALLTSEMARGASEHGASEHGASDRARDGASTSDTVRALANGDVVLTRLQDQLLGWFGPDGVNALVVRALDRTRSVSPVLDRLHHPKRGTLRLSAITEDSAVGNGDGLTVTEVNEAIVALVAAILTLIARLVGDDMMRHLIGQIWPSISGGAAFAPGKSPITMRGSAGD
jgi:hypothetical protein